MSNKPVNFFDVTDKAMKHFGIENQVDKLIEELEEFKKALTKYKECGPIALSHVAEESADVNILMQPVIKALNIESMVKDWTNAKLKRLDKLTNKSSVG